MKLTFFLCSPIVKLDFNNYGGVVSLPSFFTENRVAVILFISW